MYDIRQFKPALYVVVLLGVAGFCLSIGSLGLLVVAGGLIGLNARSVARGTFRPAPRLVANTATLLIGIWTGMRVYGGEVPVEPFGMFLVALQVVKVWEQRGNRDYGQLVVLSLLTMIAAAMLPGGTSLLFGLLFIAWILLALYTCLLFHLKVETDAARRYLGAAAFGHGNEHEIEDDAQLRRLRQDQRRLGSSLRRLTAVVATAGTAAAVVVFVTFPRGGGQGFLHEVAALQVGRNSVTGFSGDVDLQGISRILQNESIVAHVRVEGRTDAGPLYVRGNGLDVYRSDPREPDRWTWGRSPELEMQSIGVPLRREFTGITARGVRVDQNLILQEFELVPTGSSALFTLDGPVAFRFDGDLRGLGRGGGGITELVVGADGTLSLSQGSVTRPLRYVVASTGRTPVAGAPVPADPPRVPAALLDTFDNAAEYVWPGDDLAAVRRRVEGLRLATLDRLEGGDAVERLRLMNPSQRADWVDTRLGDVSRTSTASYVLPRRASAASSPEPTQPFAGPVPAADEIIAFALDPLVTGVDDAGVSLGVRRVALAGTTDLDARIASAMERHLRREFNYSLDITGDAALLAPDRDPLGWFVSEVRRGHCELFAGTMASALQTLGIPARVVVGFASDEYNPRIGRWTVRQSHAHAWVEALTTDGWVRYDPTPADGIGSPSEESAFYRATRGIRQIGEYLQYAWQNNVVAYSRDDQEQVRDSMFARLDRELVRAVNDADARRNHVELVTEAVLGPIQRAAQRFGMGGGVAGVVAAVAGFLLTLLPVAALGAVAWFVFERWRLKRRAARIGLDALPPEEARRLARQLGFYDAMVRLLDRHDLRRLMGETPREFASRLAADVPPDAFRRVVGLTEVYYRVRFGRGHVSPLRRRLLDREVDLLAASFGR